MVSPDSAGRRLTTGLSRFSGIGAATRTGYTLTGYYDAATGGTQVYDASGRAVSGTYWDGAGSSAKFKGLANASATSLTVYARWTVNSYSVTLDRQGGSGGTTNVTATYGATMPSATMPTRTGYTFGGYYTGASGGGTQYYNADGASVRSWNIASNTTLYAKWTPIGYMVTFDMQYGSGGTASVTATYDSAMPTITVPTRAGYTFGGYYTGMNGSGTQYYTASGTSASAWGVAGNSILYAKWVPREYTLKINPYGGQYNNSTGVTTVVQKLRTGTSSHRAISVATRLGYRFLGYFDEMDGGNRTHDADGRAVNGTYWDGDYGAPALFKGLANANATTLTVYARWEAREYTLKIDPNGGQYNNTTGVTTAAQKLKTDTDRYCEIRVATRTGYRLLGYFDAPDGGNQTHDADGRAVNGTYWAGDYGASALFKGLANANATTLTVYARWEAREYTLKIDPNGGQYNNTTGVTTAAQKLKTDTDRYCEIRVATRTGYRLLGYFDAPDGGNQTHDADGRAVNGTYWAGDYGAPALFKGLDDAAAESLTVYAHWEARKYTVTFDANGGEGTMDSMLCTYDVPAEIPDCTFTRDGWGFSGWTTNGVDEVLFAPNASVSNLTTTAEVTLLACWTGVTYQVVLDARDERGNGVMTNGVGEAVSVLTNLVVVGEAWNLPAPTNVNENLNFVEWKYGGNQTARGEVPPPSSGSTNLVAAWTDDLAAAVDAPSGMGFRTFGRKGSQLQDPYRADWFAQTNVVCDSESAVQSGALPSVGDGITYASLLKATTITGKGTLTFWWRCEAAKRVRYADFSDPGNPTEVVYGEALHFGILVGENESNFTNLVTELEGVTDWCQVVYTKLTDEPVTFIWKFQYDSIGGSQNGGGTGWVDRVTWTPDDVTQTHSVPYIWLSENFPDKYASASGVPGKIDEIAEGDSPNGKPMKVWQEYWAGTNPKDPNDLFRANIVVSNDVPYISWQPDLSTGMPERVYKVLCAPAPSAQEWVEWPGPGDSGASTNRFFKVKLILEEE